jgi:hypothetical protein
MTPFRIPPPARAILGLVLILLGAGAVLSAAQPAAPPPPTGQEQLKIFVLEGQGAVNYLPEKRGRTPVVEVRDENDLPVEGAEVLFELPSSGPGGEFVGGGHSKTVRTGIGGQAAAPFTVNNQAGSFQIRVTAKIGDKIGRAVIGQVNSATPVMLAPQKKTGWLTTRKLLIFSSVAAAGVVAGVMATNGGSSTSAPAAPPAPPTIIISPGSPTFGGPR